MRCPRADPGHERISTLDIETTHFEPDRGELVSIGVGVHDRGEPAREATYDTYHRDGNGEAALVRRAFDRLAEYDADELVTYNGVAFDLSFVEERLDRIDGAGEPPAIRTATERHTDLFVERKRRADRDGKRWPSLEDCLDAYGYPRPVTVWDGQEVTNTRFGDELGPAYLSAITDDSRRTADLEAVIDHYLVTDLEANVALYYADVGAEFDPYLLGTNESF